METNSVVIDSTTHTELVRRLSEKVKAYYVFPDIAEEICRRLQKHLQDGEYADITDGEFLAFALTTHMQEVNHDEHLWVRWHPEPLPDDDRPLRYNPEWMAERQQEARLDNYGLHKVERLPGNVGYLDIHYLHRPAWGGDTAIAAMSFLANVSALIIDLRQCAGGYPGMVALISSYLFGEEPVHLGSIYWREEDLTQQYWTFPYVPGKRLGDKPVYVLIGKATFSAGGGICLRSEKPPAGHPRRRENGWRRSPRCVVSPSSALRSVHPGWARDQPHFGSKLGGQWSHPGRLSTARAGIQGCL